MTTVPLPLDRDFRFIPPKLPKVLADNTVLDPFELLVTEGDIRLGDGTTPGGIVIGAGGEAPEIPPFQQDGDGAIERPLEEKAKDFATSSDFVSPTATGPVTASLVNAINSRRTEIVEGSRTYCGEIKLKAGRYYVDGEIDLAALGAVRGLTISGEGDSSTQIILTTPTATFKGASCSGVTFRDLTIRGLDPDVDAAYMTANGLTASGVDVNQTAFTLTHTTGSPLRFWHFQNVVFSQLWKCFGVTGAMFVDGFKFKNCRALQCYHFMDNANDQAVNWNLFDVDWENEALVTTKDKNLAAMFLLQKATTVVWIGGSAIFHGSLVRLNITAPNSLPATASGFVALGVKTELVDNMATSGPRHAPIFDRNETGWANGGNEFTATMIHCPMINRGSIGQNFTIAKLWNNMTLTLRDCKWRGGNIVGIINPITETQCGRLVIDNCSPSIRYVEDRSGSPANEYICHSVDIRYADSGSSPSAAVSLRNAGGFPQVRQETVLTFEVGNGNCPTDDVVLPIGGLPARAFIKTIFVDLVTPMAAELMVSIVDAADTVAYATLTLAAGQKHGEVVVNKRVGVDIPDDVKLKFNDGSAVTKGHGGIRYV